MHPPLIFLGWMAAGYLVGSFWGPPGRTLALPWLLGPPVVAVGFGLSLWSVIEFLRWGTHPDPHRPTTAVITSGPFRFTRNPIYVAFTVMHVGAALWAGNAFVLATALPAALTIHYAVIVKEERYLERKFGKEYTDYRQSTRRWL